MARRIRRFLALQTGERRLFLESRSCFRVVETLLPLLGVRRSMRTAAFLGGVRRSHSTAVMADVVAIVALAASSRRRPPRCLARSLALQLVLARRGIESAMVIGVRPDGPALDAHAWLEVEGAVVGDPAGMPSSYARIDGQLLARHA